RRRGSLVAHEKDGHNAALPEWVPCIAAASMSSRPETSGNLDESGSWQVPVGNRQARRFFAPLVIASVAKQSRASDESMDCFVAERVLGPAFGQPRGLLARTIAPRSSARATASRPPPSLPAALRQAATAARPPPVGPSAHRSEPWAPSARARRWRGG